MRMSCEADVVEDTRVGSNLYCVLSLISTMAAGFVRSFLLARLGSCTSARVYVIDYQSFFVLFFRTCIYVHMHIHSACLQFLFSVHLLWFAFSFLLHTFGETTSRDSSFVLFRTRVIYYLVMYILFIRRFECCARRRVLLIKLAHVV